MSTYIKLEDALNLVKLDERYEWTLERLNSLPYISFEEMIRQEIEDSQKSIDNDPLTPRGLELSEMRIAILNQLLNKLPK